MLDYSELVQAASQADFLVVLAPYSKQNDKIINARVLAAMKPSAYLINISRGGVCDEEAILAALRENRIAGAGLDAFATEPLPSDHPLWRLENVTATPHVGGGSDFPPALSLPILETNMKCFLDDRCQDMINIVPRAVI
jgi:D-2-hydroxyacid dehydrogenase (NADP+)